MAFTEIFGLGGPNLKYLVRGGQNLWGQNVP